MPVQQQIDQHLLAIEINALRVAEIAALRRECAFWRERCRVLEAVVNLPVPQPARRAGGKGQGRAASSAAVSA